MTSKAREERVLLSIADTYDADRAQHVAQLVSALRNLNVERVDRYVSKLVRAIGQSDELRATLRGGVYARELAEAGAAVTIEPRGGLGRI